MLGRERRLGHFEAVMLPHRDAAFRLARWLTRSDEDARDVVQDAYLRALRLFDSYRGENAAAWLLTVVRHAAYDWLRRRRPREVLALDDPDAPPLDDAALTNRVTPETLLLERRDQARLAELLAALPVPLREVLVLREFQELSYQEIATVINAPIGTVMSRLSRARAALRQAWIGPERERRDRGL